MKLFRKLATLSLTAALSAGMVLPASAASAPAVQVGGGTVDTSAYINADSRTMVPVTIAEALGLDCTADGDSATFSLCGLRPIAPVPRQGIPQPPFRTASSMSLSTIWLRLSGTK